MTDTTELVARLRAYEPYNHFKDGPLIREAADTIERLTRERDEARAACAMNNDTHLRISADYTQTIRALETRIAKLEWACEDIEAARTALEGKP
jgi:hypothetical protein